MKIIGLTGGIGSGKSTVSGYLREKGFFVIDADQVARDIMEPGMPTLSRLAKAFGSGIIDENGALKRKELAVIAFSSDENKAKLDEITHGDIKNRIEELIEECRQKDEKICFLDVPLLFEVGLDEKCDFVWVVTANMEKRIERVVARDNTTRQDVEARIRCQMSDEEKIEKSDDVIDNSHSLDALHKDIERLLEKYEKRNIL